MCNLVTSFSSFFFHLTIEICKLLEIENHCFLWSHLVPSSYHLLHLSSFGRTKDAFSPDCHHAKLLTTTLLFFVLFFSTTLSEIFKEVKLSNAAQRLFNLVVHEKHLFMTGLKGVSTFSELTFSDATVVLCYIYYTSK